MKKGWLFLLLLTVAACSEQTKDKRTAIFSDYLQEQFNRSIPETHHYYLLVPKQGCQGAIFEALRVIDAVNTEGRKQTTVITSNPDMLKNCLHGNWEILEDHNAKLDVLNLGVTNVSLITTENGRIVSVKTSNKCESDIGSEIRHTMDSLR